MVLYRVYTYMVYIPSYGDTPEDGIIMYVLYNTNQNILYSIFYSSSKNIILVYGILLNTCIYIHKKG